MQYIYIYVCVFVKKYKLYIYIIYLLRQNLGPLDYRLSTFSELYFKTPAN